MSIYSVGSGYADYSAYSVSAASSGSSAAEEIGVNGGSGAAEEANLGADTFVPGNSGSDIEELQAKKEQVQSELGELQGQAADTNAQILSRKEDLIREQGGEQNGAVQEDYEAAKAEYEESAAAKEQAGQELQQAQQDNDANEKAITSNEQKRSQTTADLNSAQNELNSLAKPAQPGGDDEAAQAEYQAQLNAYNAKKQELENRIASLQQQLQQINSEAQQLQQKKLQLDSDQGKARAEIDKQEYLMQFAQYKMDQLQQSMIEDSPALQSAVEEDGELQSLQEELEQLQQQAADKNAELAEIDGQINSAYGLGPDRGTLAAGWAEDEVSSDTEKLMEAMAAEGFDTAEEDGVIRISGTEGDDKIDITMGADGSYKVVVNGEESVYSAEEARRLMIDSGEGDDKIRVHYDEGTASFTDAAEQDGGAGDDAVRAHIGIDRIEQDAGGEGSDEIEAKGGPGDDRVAQSGGEGRDEIEVKFGLGDDRVEQSGGAGSDDIEVKVGPGDDRIVQSGAEGSDAQEVFSGMDMMDSMNGFNTNPPSPAEPKPRPVIVINGGDGSDVIEADENVTAQLFATGGSGDDKITGGAANDYIIDSQGSNTIEGNAGDDVIITGNEADVITDKGGSNVIYSKGGDDTVTVSGEGYSDVYGGAGNDVLSASDGSYTIPTFSFGSLSSLMVPEDKGGHHLHGEDGDDVLTSYSGRSTLSGGDGSDIMTAVDGQADMSGDAGQDNLIAYKGQHKLSGGADDDVLTVYDGTSSLHGDDGNDKIKAFRGDHALYGDEGDDTVEGGAGREYIEGGGGNDVIDGGGGGDVIYAGDGDDEVSGGDGDDYINAGRGNDKVHGNAGNDIIFGLDGDDELYGDEGRDTMASGKGNDVVDGGADADRIRWTDSDKNGHDAVLNLEDSDDAQVLEPIDVPYDHFKIDPRTVKLHPIFGVVTGYDKMEMSAAAAFERIMQDNLEAFAAIEPGQELLGGIADTKYGVTFMHLDVNNGLCIPADDNGNLQIKETENGIEVEPGKGCDSIVAINPSFIDFGAISEEAGELPYAEQNTMIVMDHELDHAYNNATGTLDDSYYDNDTGEWLGKDRPSGNDRALPGAELQAVGLHKDKMFVNNPYGRTENDLREYFGMDLRTSYMTPKNEEQ